MIEITDEEVERAVDCWFNTPGEFTARMEASLSDFLANRPAPVAALRPIAEMPADLPKNCQAITGVLYNHAENPYFETDGAGIYGPCDHFVIFQLPTATDPEADLRREFEEATKNLGKWDFRRHPSGEYEFLPTEIAWMVWNLRGEQMKKGAKP